MTANTDLITLVTGDSTYDIREDAWVNDDGWVPPPDDDGWCELDLD